MFERLRRLIAAKPETRASVTGYTTQVMEARESYLMGRRGMAVLTATVQGCVSLWEHDLAQAARPFPLPSLARQTV